MKKLYELLWPDVFQSAKKGKLKRVKKFLSDGVNIDTEGFHGRTILMFAAMGHQADIVKYLLDNGAHPNAKDNNGSTALSHIPAPFPSSSEIAKSLECAKFLIEHGADVNAKDDDGISVLMAATISSPDLVELLIKKGAKSNHINNDGESTIMWAVTFPNKNIEKILDLLIENGADKSVKDKQGKTALERFMEEEFEHPETDDYKIAEILNLSVDETNKENISSLSEKLILTFGAELNPVLDEIDKLSSSGNKDGITALEKAIRTIGGNRSATFYIPGKSIVDFQLSGEDQAMQLVELASKGQLLNEPNISGKLWMNFRHNMGDDDELQANILKAGGPNQEKAFVLLTNHIRNFALFVRAKESSK